MGPPEKVSFLPVTVMEVCPEPVPLLPFTHGAELWLRWKLVERQGELVNVEDLLLPEDGEFLKHNDNGGKVMSNNATALAFSHFTFEASNHDVVVIDIQGVKDTATNTYRWTDPQIHSRDGIENGNIADGSGFASGNYGQDGMKKFVRTHVCNGICKHMGLPLLCEHELPLHTVDNLV